MDSALIDLTNKVSGNAALKAAGITVSGSAGGALTFTSARGEKVNVMATGDTANVLGLGTFLAGAGNAADYTTKTAGAAYDNSTKEGTTVLEFSLNGAASNGGTNSVSVNLDGGDALGATVTASADSDQHGKTLTFSIDGAAATTVTLAAGDTTAAAAVARIQATAFTGVNATVNCRET